MNGAEPAGPFLSPVEEAVYGRLLDGVTRSVEQLSALVGQPHRAVAGALTSLEARGLALRLPGEPDRYDARHPQEGFAAELERQEDGVRRTARLIQSYTMRYLDARRSVVGPEVIEVLADAGEIYQRVRRIQGSARHDLRICDRPPYFADPDEVEMLDHRGSGVRYRVISDSSSRALRDPSAWERWEAAGQETREMTGVPVKMMIADDRIAVMTPAALDATVRTSLIIHPSSLLHSLVAIFDSLWNAATPRNPLTEVGGPIEERLTADDSALLSLMASGVTDAVIARRLGISQRTLQRRVHDLMQRVGAGNRFQAGLWAARRGYL